MGGSKMLPRSTGMLPRSNTYIRRLLTPGAFEACAKMAPIGWPEVSAARPARSTGPLQQTSDRRVCGAIYSPLRFGHHSEFPLSCSPRWGTQDHSAVKRHPIQDCDAVLEDVRPLRE